MWRPLRHLAWSGVTHCVHVYHAPHIRRLSSRRFTLLSRPSRPPSSSSTPAARARACPPPPAPAGTGSSRLRAAVATTVTLLRARSTGARSPAAAGPVHPGTGVLFFRTSMKLLSLARFDMRLMRVRSCSSSMDCAGGKACTDTVQGCADGREAGEAPASEPAPPPRPPLLSLPSPSPLEKNPLSAAHRDARPVVGIQLGFQLLRGGSGPVGLG